MGRKTKLFIGFCIFAVALVLVPASGFAASVVMPQTGQTTCWDELGISRACAGTGEDAEFTKGAAMPSPRYTDNSDGTVTDNYTGLMWLKDANCADTIGWDPDSTGDGSTTWQQGLDFVNGINAGTHDISTCESYSGSYTDWRTPSILELLSQTNVSEAQPALTSGHPFSNVQWSSGYQYWSSTTEVDEGYQDYAYRLNFNSGGYWSDEKSTQDYFNWPVRAGQVDGQPDSSYPANVWATGQTTCYDESGLARTCMDVETQVGVSLPSPRFTDNGDGTIRDNLTDLLWLKDANCANTISWDPEITGDGTMTWQQGLDFVNGVNDGTHDISTCASYTASYTNWRMPNLLEIRSFVDFSAFKNTGDAINSNNFPLTPGHPFVNLPDDDYWTSTTHGIKRDYARTFDTNTGPEGYPKDGSYGSLFIMLVSGPRVLVSAISGNTTEAGSTATFTVRLSSEPLEDVTIPVSSSDETEGTVGPASLVFTSADWADPQTVTVTGVDDQVNDGDQTYTIILSSVSSLDLNYDGIDPADVSVTNIDNDEPSGGGGGGGGGGGDDDGGGDGGCFIATAAYGSYMDSNVKVLREFRDNYLLTNTLGRALVDVYYSYSPPVADYIAAHPSLKVATRIAFAPVVATVRNPALMLAGVFTFVGLIAIRPIWRRRRG